MRRRRRETTSRSRGNRRRRAGAWCRRRDRALRARRGGFDRRAASSMTITSSTGGGATTTGAGATPNDNQCDGFPRLLGGGSATSAGAAPGRFGDGYRQLPWAVTSFAGCTTGSLVRLGFHIGFAGRPSLFTPGSRRASQGNAGLPARMGSLIALDVPDFGGLPRTASVLDLAVVSAPTIALAFRLWACPLPQFFAGLQNM